MSVEYYGSWGQLIKCALNSELSVVEYRLKRLLQEFRAWELAKGSWACVELSRFPLSAAAS